METLRRDPSAAAAEAHDLIIVGGGIYGAMTALEAARRGLRPLLLERDDYGGATSWNSHRIVHGGLRYLQRFDLNRFRTSVRERSWFLRHFPDRVEPLTCLMPLYGQGARRPSVLRAALLANHLLSRDRNDDVRADRRIESGGVMTALETRSLFPQVREEGLRGGALWYDAVMTDSQRLLIETLRWASAYGARCLNYVEATRMRVEAGRVVGVEATDGVDDATLLFDAAIVVNCAGPWSGRVASAFDRPMEELFRPSLAFNLLFDRAPPSEVAVAVSAPGPGAHTWFLYPRSGRTYAGTAHVPCAKGTETATPSQQQIDAAINDMNAAVPGLDLRRRQVMRVYSGLLPATEQGSTELTSKPLIHDHGGNGGARGLFSVSGVKYTTARDVAEKTLRRAFAGLGEIGEETGRPQGRVIPAIGAAADGNTGDNLAEAVRRFADDEAVVHLDDLLLRRGDWGDDPRTLQRTGQAVAEMLGWDQARRGAELDRLAELTDAGSSGECS